MKRLSKRRFFWLERHRVRSARAKLRQRAKAAARRKSFRRIKIWLETQQGRERAWASRRIPAPEIFDLEANYEECARCLQSLRETLTGSIEQYRRLAGTKPIKRRRVSSFLDFATIKKCTPSTALVLAAEYDRARSLMPWNIRLINLDGWRRELVELLDQIGFFDLLGIDRPAKQQPKHSDISVVPFATGNTFGNEEASKLMSTVADMILQADPGGLSDEAVIPARMRLYAALVEACENTRRHAYHEDEGYDPAIRRWWMTGAVCQSEKRLTLVVYDQGATIPHRLPTWEGFDLIRKVLTRLLGADQVAAMGTAFDSLVLRVAMTMPRPSEVHRGKGFPAFMDVVRASKKGRLRVVSRHAEFIYESGKHPRTRQLVVPLGGTLVEWDLWL